MRKLAVLTFQTLDGVMQAPSMPEEDFSGDFESGGWARPCWDEVMAQVGREAMAEPYDLLLGRTTYDMFASSFASAPASDPTAARLNAARKYVVSGAQGPLPWQNSERISGDLVAGITQLKSATGPLLQVHGSWQLVQLLNRHQLVDEYRLWTFPVVVGAGKRLFENGAVPATLRLSRLERTPSGAVMNFWQPV